MLNVGHCAAFCPRPHCSAPRSAGVALCIASVHAPRAGAPNCQSMAGPAIFHTSGRLTPGHGRIDPARFRHPLISIKTQSRSTKESYWTLVHISTDESHSAPSVRRRGVGFTCGSAAPTGSERRRVVMCGIRAEVTLRQRAASGRDVQRAQVCLLSYAARATAEPNYGSLYGRRSAPQQCRGQDTTHLVRATGPQRTPVPGFDRHRTRRAHHSPCGIRYVLPEAGAGSGAGSACGGTRVRRSPRALTRVRRSVSPTPASTATSGVATLWTAPERTAEAA